MPVNRNRELYAHHFATAYAPGVASSLAASDRGAEMYLRIREYVRNVIVFKTFSVLLEPILNRGSE